MNYGKEREEQKTKKKTILFVLLFRGKYFEKVSHKSNCDRVRWNIIFFPSLLSGFCSIRFYLFNFISDCSSVHCGYCTSWILAVLFVFLLMFTFSLESCSCANQGAMMKLQFLWMQLLYLFISFIYFVVCSCYCYGSCNQ